MSHETFEMVPKASDTLNKIEAVLTDTNELFYGKEKERNVIRGLPSDYV